MDQAGEALLHLGALSGRQRQHYRGHAGAPRKLDQLTKILILVSIIFVVFFQRRIVSGLTSGAVKG